MSNEPHVVIIELPIKYVLKLKNSIDHDIRGHGVYFADLFLMIVLAAHRKTIPLAPKEKYNRLERTLIMAIYRDYLNSLEEFGHGVLNNYIPSYLSEDTVALYNKAAINKELEC